MFRSVRPFALEAGADGPVVCYQGALVADAAHRRGPQPSADPARARARGDRVRSRRTGYGVNCYVDDELYVAEVTPEARFYADYQGIRCRSTPSATCSSGSTAADEARRRRTSRRGSTRSRRRLRARLRRRPARRPLAAVLPRGRRRGRDEGDRPRRLRRAARLLARATRSRSATAERPRADRRGPATASPWRTRTRSVLGARGLRLPAGGRGRRGAGGRGLSRLAPMIDLSEARE